MRYVVSTERWGHGVGTYVCARRVETPIPALIWWLDNSCQGQDDNNEIYLPSPYARHCPHFSFVPPQHRARDLRQTFMMCKSSLAWTQAFLDKKNPQQMRKHCCSNFKIIANFGKEIKKFSMKNTRAGPDSEDGGATSARRTSGATRGCSAYPATAVRSA